MDLRAQLLEEHSRANAEAIANYIGTDPGRFDQLLSIFFSKEGPFDQRAAYSLDLILREYPEMARPHLEAMVAVLNEEVHDAVKRAVVRLLQFVEIPDQLMGDLMDHCYGILENPNEAIALRVFSMTILYNISKKEPDLKRELKLMIEAHLPYGSSGFKNRGKKILKKLDKELKAMGAWD